MVRKKGSASNWTDFGASIATALCGFVVGLMSEGLATSLVPTKARWLYIAGAAVFGLWALYVSSPLYNRRAKIRNRWICWSGIVTSFLCVTIASQVWWYAPNRYQMVETKVLDWVTRTDPEMKIVEPLQGQVFRFEFKVPIPIPGIPTPAGQQVTLNVALRSDDILYVWHKRSYTAYSDFLNSLPPDRRELNFKEIADYIYGLDNIHARVVYVPNTRPLNVHMARFLDTEELSLTKFSEATSDLHRAYARMMLTMQGQQDKVN